MICSSLTLPPLGSTSHNQWLLAYGRDTIPIGANNANGMLLGVWRAAVSALSPTLVAIKGTKSSTGLVPSRTSRELPSLFCRVSLLGDLLNVGPFNTGDGDSTGVL
jgi:hypothetical protein